MLVLFGFVGGKKVFGWINMGYVNLKYLPPPSHIAFHVMRGRVINDTSWTCYMGGGGGGDMMLLCVQWAENSGLGGSGINQYLWVGGGGYVRFIWCQSMTLYHHFNQNHPLVVTLYVYNSPSPPLPNINMTEYLMVEGGRRS